MLHKSVSIAALLIVQLTTATGTTFGKTFLFALPKIKRSQDDTDKPPSIHFYLFTLESVKFDVQFKIEWPSLHFPLKDPMKATLRLIKNKIAKLDCWNDDCNYRGETAKRFTFSFEGPYKFGMSVMLHESPHSGAMFTAVPVEAWGIDYYAVTLRRTPSIQITTYKPNQILIKMKAEQPQYLKIKYLGNVYGDNDKLDVLLNPKESFDFSYCTDVNDYGGLTGTYIRGQEPIGVVSGSCRAMVNFIWCDTLQLGNEGCSDIASEMLMPAHSFGKEFILFKVHSRLTNSQFMVMSKFDDTKLTIYSKNINEDEYTYETIQVAGTTLKLDLLRTASYTMVSDKVVQVTHAMRQKCYYLETGATEEHGDPSISILVPNELFFYVYVWGTPNLGALVKFFVTIIIRWANKRKIYMNNKVVEEKSFKHETVGAWNVMELQLQEGDYRMYLENNFYFGCYVYGLGKDYGYMRPGGAVVAAIYDTECQKTMKAMTIIDMIDNDCDGKVDEEKEDGRDNDNDNEVDEDLGAIEDDAVLKWRARTTTPPPGVGCPSYTWGAGCRQSCRNCVHDCVKWTGACTECTPGFTNAKQGCEQACGKYTYGKDCTGDCAKKCEGLDCHERVYGECHACPIGYWGKDCRETCFNCKDGCDTSYGRCSSCVAGFKSPVMHCNQACGSYEYGEDCKGSCATKCKGKDCYERRFGECSKCPVKKWGLDCAMSCSNCNDDCDKSYGTCKYCLAGFKYANQGCNTSCGVNEYGEDCRGDCLTKCKKDCFERVYGSCSEAGSWEEWRCSRVCSDRFMYRKRICGQQKSLLCDDTKVEKKSSNCYTSGTCPGNCPAFTWDIDCKKSCKNCKTDCDKFNGSCELCRAGFKNPTLSCSKGCDAFEYGEGCSGNCKIKCNGKDCYDRINGTCVVDGGIGEWSAWRCARDCESTHHIRTRACDNPPPAYGGLNCTEETSQKKDVSCLAGIICPEDCGPFAWGINCNKSCANCKEDCNKIDGSCTSCKAGYQNAIWGCTVECGAYQFGEDCQGDCRVQCSGMDCANRVTGDCGFNLWKYVPLLSPLLLLPLCLFFFIRSKKRHEEVSETTSYATKASPYTFDSNTSAGVHAEQPTGSETDAMKTSASESVADAD